MPSSSRMGPGPSTSPEYVHATGIEGKRRRPSIEDEQESARAKQVPRLYLNEKASQRPMPPISLRVSTGADARLPARTSPFTPSAAGLPTPIEVSERPELGPLPSLPTNMPIEAEGPASAGPIPRRFGDSPHTENFHRGPRQYPPPGPSIRGPPTDPQSPGYRHAGYHHYPPYQAQHPHYPMTRSTGAAGTMSPVRTADSSYPHSGFPHHHHHQHPRDLPGYGDAGLVGGDGKQRKRRGNLPKETTDKLRAWFVANLSHPYPSEDEKQKLMRQTGLQMSRCPLALGPRIPSPLHCHVSVVFIHSG